MSGSLARVRAGLGRSARGLTLFALIFIAACSSLKRQSSDFSSDSPIWRGRLAVKTEGDLARSYSAGFELRGNPSQGKLGLYGPLGTTLAELSWSPEGAWLLAQGQRQNFASLEALTLQTVGTPVPLAALFSWLQGRAEPVPGWVVDFSQHAQGRLVARRGEPQAATELRLVLER